MKKKILVTGGAGYIGSHTVVALYLSGYFPIIVDNLCNSTQQNINGINEILKLNIPFYNIDCTDLKKMKFFFNQNEDILACIHFAAYKSVSESISNPQKYYFNNVKSVEVILQCLEKHKNKNLIFSSSCTVYGNADFLPVNENTPFKKPLSPYAHTKQICENLVSQSLCNNINLRYFNPIGSHDSNLIGDCSFDENTNLVPLLCKVALGTRNKLFIYGDDYDTNDGTCIRDYIHVQDLADAHVNALEYLIKNPDKHVFNISSENWLSVLDIIDLFEKANNLKLDYEVVKRRIGDVDKIYSNSSRASDILNWKAKRTIDEALISAWIWEKSKNI